MAVSSSSSCSCNKSFCSDYMLLNPEDATWLDIFKLLFSEDVSQRKFVDCPDGARPEPFPRRWIMFLSIFILKVLHDVKKPMAWLGATLDTWVNLLSANGGFFRLLKNSIRGKVVNPPENTSADFVSFIGYTDTRHDLNPEQMSSTISDKQYVALLSILASKASYENNNFIQSLVNDKWKMNFLGFYDFWNDYQQKNTTQAFVLEDNKDLIVVAFRGTELFDADAWSTDCDLSWYELPGIGKVHGGFMKALGLQKSQGWPEKQGENKPQTAYYTIRDLLEERLKNNDKAKFIVTGHSLGGALAALFPAILGMHDKYSWMLERLDGVYTYGQPRVGDDKFAQFMKNIIEKYEVDWYRFVYCFDVVPRVPFDNSSFMYKHFGTCIYYNSFYEGRVVEEEVNSNYFSLIWLIPKIANAWWELIRSFTITYTRGKEYGESGVMLIFRVIGLLIMAGAPAHCFQDYHNATRLGLSNVPLRSNKKKTLKVQ